MGNDLGYRIERYLISRNGQLLPQPEKTVVETLTKRWDEAEWEQLVISDKYAAIAAQALFGDRFEVDLANSDILNIVNKVKENEQRFSFAMFCADLSPLVAKASGLWFTDKNVKPGEKYLYRVIVNGPDNRRGSVFAGAGDPYRLPEPQNLSGEWKNGVVTLRWDQMPFNQYTAFVLERSNDGSNFYRISETPVIAISEDYSKDTKYEYAMDSVPDNFNTYYYRVRGITPFGEEGPPSNIVSGRSVPSVERVPFIVSAFSSDNVSISVTWDFPATSNAAISGFNIERSPGPQQTYVVLNKQLIRADERSFNDTSPRQVNYYRIQALGLDGNLYSSHAYFAQLVDSIPPQAPEGLHATVDDTGKVLLSWSHNPDPDIYGYRVYRSYHLSEESAQITDSPLTDNKFFDQLDLNTLNEHVYYRLMALDINQNHSELSKPFKVILPDKVKPQPPVILPRVSDTTCLILSWLPGPSDDIVAYKIYRKLALETKWFHLSTVPVVLDSIYTYTDVNCLPNEQAYYTIVSVDDAGLESDPAPPVSRQCLARALSPRVEWRRPRLTEEENKLALSWTYDQPGVEYFRIFKAVNDGPLMLLQSLGRDERGFTDTITPGNRYIYRIVAALSHGQMSMISAPLIFDY